MASNLRVDSIVPSSSGNVSIGTATGGVTIPGDLGIAGVLTYEDVTNVDSVGVVTARSGVNVSGGEIKVGAAVTVSSGGVITSGIVTATSFGGSGANLTFNSGDGNGAFDFNTTAHVKLPSGTSAQRVNSTGAIRFNSDLGNLEFYDGTTWRRINSTPAAPINGLLAYWPFSSASRSGSTYNDLSGNNHDLTVYGTITDDTTESKFTDGCIDFGTADGNHYLKSTSNSFADIDSTSGYSGVSVSVWIRSTVTNNTNQWIISEGTVNSRWNYFIENANAPKWRSENGGDIIQTGSVLTGNWHHVVVTWQSSNNLVKHYRDGSFTNQGTTAKSPSFNGEYLLVGQHSVLQGTTSTYRWRGKMAHMRIYNRVLTANEVGNLYSQWS